MYKFVMVISFLAFILSGIIPVAADPLHGLDKSKQTPDTLQQGKKSNPEPQSRKIETRGFLGEGPTDFEVPSFFPGRQARSRLVSKPEKIRFLASDDFPPFTFRDSEKRLMGYNVDLARAICENLEVACSLQVLPFEELIGALARGEGDAIIAGVAINKKTLEHLSFSEVYMRFPGRFVARKEETLPPNPRFLKGQKVGVVIGSRHEAYLETFFPETEIIKVTSESALKEALLENKVSRIFGDGMRLAFWLDTPEAQACCHFNGDAYIDPEYLNGGMTIAVQKKDKLTLDALNLALSRLQTHGDLTDLYLRYFPISFF
ncbi:transporter substrate-binding domain-containing protein [Polycladidibacter stylochi]|uniref:transporter substrate-binding domain-containing protein n=1 Tax=Polycladidibacter stylochi TaxID=1807766 RepID=UPI00082DE1FF|nr:transporter substrate-binding domain-containing protein [Pseudovibrio stylochi]